MKHSKTQNAHATGEHQYGIDVHPDAPTERARSNLLDLAVFDGQEALRVFHGPYIAAAVSAQEIVRFEVTPPASQVSTAVMQLVGVGAQPKA